MKKAEYAIVTVTVLASQHFFANMQNMSNMQNMQNMQNMHSCTEILDPVL